MTGNENAGLPTLTEDISKTALREFFRDKPFVFLGTGMSCAVDSRFGMPALTSELKRSVIVDAGNRQQSMQWSETLESLNCGDDLETALDHVTDPQLLHTITSATADFISGLDREFALRMSQGYVEWPAVVFFKLLVDSLPSSDSTLHVLTPNYDTLLEHSCDAHSIPYTTGFCGGLQRTIDWPTAIRSMQYTSRVMQRRRLRTVTKDRKHIRLYKVHGSLNLFFQNNIVVENNSWMWNAPDFTSRVMIAPGLSKFQTLQNYRRELLAYADAAIDQANRFIFLGYGFNDSHLESYINRKLIENSCRGIIVTRDSNVRIESLLRRSENLWLVCKMSEPNQEGTRIFNKQYSDWLVIPDKRLWDIATFTAEILGG
ncbi:MAG: SIR2 family protein [Chloroflexota bacterium]|nr:SIR2 family protein [Chloroflexota bacterium]